MQRAPACVPRRARNSFAQNLFVIADAAQGTVRLGAHLRGSTCPTWRAVRVKHMADIINLNQFRKARARAEKERLAEQSRVRHGQTRSTKEAARRETERQAVDLDGKLLQLKDPLPEPTGAPDL